MALFDGIFEEVGNQYGGAVGGALSSLRSSSNPLFGGLAGKKRGRAGNRKNDPRGFPMMVRDGRMATINYGTNLTRLNFIPAAKFLFFVRFVRPMGSGYTLRGMSSPTDTSLDWSGGLGFTMKRIDRPGMSFQTQVLNQYNKKRVIQTKVEYEPISVTFYDTYDLRIHEMFQQYFRYYYGDGSKTIYDWSYDVTNRDFRSAPWGFSPNQIANPNDGNFFSHIEIYTFGNGSYTRTDLINPKITKFNPSDLSYEEGLVTQEITMSIEYEGLVQYNEGKKSPMAGSILELSRLNLADYYESEDGPIGDGSLTSSWLGNPSVAQPDILSNLLNDITTAAVSGRPVTGKTVSNSVLNSFGKFNFGAGGMSGGNNTMGSLLTTGTSGLTSGASGNQILGGMMTGAGYGPVAGAVQSGNYTGLALAGTVGAVSSLFSGTSPSSSAGSRIQWNGERGAVSQNTQALAAMNGQNMTWQQYANNYNSGQQATTFTDYTRYSGAAQNYQNALASGNSTTILPTAEEYRSEFDRIRDSYRGT